MNNPAKIVLRKSVCAAGLLALACLISGCKTTFRTVDTRFMAQPANHQRVQILPVWFESAGNVDHTLTTNDLQSLSRQAGENLSAAVQDTLLSKGYEIVGHVDMLDGDKKLSALNPEIRRQLEAVRLDFCENLPRSYASANSENPLTFRTNSTLGFFRFMATPDPKRAVMEQNPFHYQITPALTNLAARPGAADAEAFLLVDTKAFFESKHNHTKRTVWNWTGGGVVTVTEVGVNLAVVAAAALSGAGGAPVPIWVDPFWHSSNSLQHNVALVDVRTGEVLWLNRQSFKHKNPREAGALAETVANAFLDLPPIRGGNIAIRSQPMSETATP
jgi:hypothetical protein